MTKEELIDRLNKLKDMEPERGDVLADDLLIEYIGDEDIKQAYESLDKWYA